MIISFFSETSKINWAHVASLLNDFRTGKKISHAEIKHTMIGFLPIRGTKGSKHNKDFCPIQVKHVRLECR